ncbi:MAG: hypothetical protein GX259_10070 [Bacteroidales bacterium]|nr:hypothetical protein [Bacteroidales bacterium]
MKKVKFFVFGIMACLFILSCKNVDVDLQENSNLSPKSETAQAIQNLKNAGLLDNLLK